MNKTFEIQIFNIDGTYYDNLPRGEIMSDFSYTSNINMWQWNANIELDLPFENNIFQKWQYIKVFVFTDTFKEWILVYSWQINQITRQIYDGIEKIELSVLWKWSLLNYTYFQDTWAYTFNKNDTASNIIKEIIDDFNAKYIGAWLYYDVESIEETVWNINIDFNYTKSIDAIKNIANIVWFNFYIEADGKVIFRNKSTFILWDDSWVWDDSEYWEEYLQESYILTKGYDLQSIQVEENSENIVNKYILQWKSWTLTPEEDVTSQNTYWIRELKESKTDISDITTAQQYAENYIAKNKDQKRNISLVVNNKFEIEVLKPMDLVSVVNLNYEIQNLQIQKINYTIDSVKIEVESFDTLAKEILTSNN